MLEKDGREYALRWTIPGPDSSYSCFEHQRFWKVESEARMEPPIQTEYFLSGGSDDLDLHARRRERSELLLHTVGNTGEHGGTTGEDDVAVQVTTDIKIALEDGVVAV